jgi:hypothetical protein
MHPFWLSLLLVLGCAVFVSLVGWYCRTVARDIREPWR